MNIKKLGRIITSEIGSIKHIKDIVSANMLYSIDISLSIWRTSGILAELFPSITKYVEYKKAFFADCEFDGLNSISEDYKTYGISHDLDQQYNIFKTHVTFYKGRPIFLFIDSLNNHKGNSVPRFCLVTFTFNGVEDFMDEFYHMIIVTSKRRTLSNFQQNITFVSDGRDGIGTHTFPVTSVPHLHRTFENIFIEDDIENRIDVALSNFLTKRKWYKEHSIPYHFGIMLYGEPGTGKSSIAQAIANKYKLETTVVACDDSYVIDETMILLENTESANIDRNQLLLVEDIDCAFLEKKYDENGKLKTRGNALGTLLNKLDGLEALEGVIYIFTTNHIDKLDPALIRPGRIDLTLHIDYVSFETFCKFMKFHYGKAPSKHFDIKPNTTFAELQTYVMEGWSYNKLVSYVKTKEEDK